ncbi:MAG: alpha/beta fold hydrolase [Marmoricola sp.]
MSTTTTRTRFAASADGTSIAYDTTGSGPALVLVDGALCQRAMGPARPLAEALSDGFSVTAYDRRGRGESGPAEGPPSVRREVEDLAAVVDAVGGHAHVFGSSSGAALALRAAGQGLAVDRLVAYEAPYVVDGTGTPAPADAIGQIQRMVDNGKRGDAVRFFLTMVGAPGPMVAIMRLFPVWRKMTAVAHTLPWDLTVMDGRMRGEPLPEGYFAEVTAPTLVIAGGKSPASMRNAQAAVAAQLGKGRLAVLEGQTHMIKPKVTAPAVRAFLAG